MKKIVSVCAMVMVVGLLATAVHAATPGLDWYTCDVVAVGPSGGTVVYVKLTDQAGFFTAKWAMVNSTDTTMVNRILASVLTSCSKYIMSVHVTPETLRYLSHFRIFHALYYVKP